MVSSVLWQDLQREGELIQMIDQRLDEELRDMRVRPLDAPLRWNNPGHEPHVNHLVKHIVYDSSF